MVDSIYFPGAGGSSAIGTASRKAMGYGRLLIAETAADEESNTSTVTVTYQINTTNGQFGKSSSSFTRVGSITVNGVAKTLSGKVTVKSNSLWGLVWSDTWEVVHDEDGSKTVTITATSPRIYESTYANTVGSGTVNFELTKFDRETGIPVYIGGVEYYCYIGNEDGTWSAADPVIG